MAWKGPKPAVGRLVSVGQGLALRSRWAKAIEWPFPLRTRTLLVEALGWFKCAAGSFADTFKVEDKLAASFINAQSAVVRHHDARNDSETEASARRTGVIGTHAAL